MIFWIVLGICILIVSEIFFFWMPVFKPEEGGWVTAKLCSICVGVFISVFIWVLPWSLAFDEGFGIQAFFYYYGAIIGIVLFFLINGWLYKKFKINKK